MTIIVRERRLRLCGRDGGRAKRWSLPGCRLNGAALDGGEGQNRTVDTTIFSRMLYQLSYLATRELGARRNRDVITQVARRSIEATGGS